MIFQEQAENCRRQATQYVGRPEAPFLLSVARAFEDLGRAANPAAFVELNGGQTRASRENIPA
jgi:hypothetical protein